MSTSPTNLNFELCSQPGTYITVDSSGYTPTPTTGQTYSVTSPSGVTVCATYVGGSTPIFGTVYTLGSLFNNCYECEISIPYSANTAYTLCSLDCSGNTIVLDVPHPVWTNGYGNAVTQLNAVQLGGPNGLNN